MIDFNELYSYLKQAIPVEESFSKESYGASNCKNLKEVSKILYCVTPSSEIDQYFRDNNYDLLICHHLGYSEVPHLTFHTAFDFCKGGLTNYWTTLLGIKDPQYITKNAGAYGELIEPIAFSELVAKLDKEVDGILGQVSSKSDIIKTIAVCSGFGAIIQKDVEKLGVDCYILGQTWSVSNPKLNGIIELGHTKSERIGVHCLKKMLKDFEVDIDVAPLELDSYGNEVAQGK